MPPRDDADEIKIIRRRDAAALGLLRYFTGKPCPKGHISERRVSKKCCIRCELDGRSAWSRKNLEKTRLQKASRYASNREAVLTAVKRYQVAKADKIKQRKRLHYLANAESIKEKARDHARKNIERVRAKNRRWRRDNPDKSAACDRNKNARRKAAEGSHTAADVAEIMKLQKSRCAYCKCNLRGKKRHVDHIHAIVKGGSNYRRNIQILCEFCNLSKHARDPIEFAQSLGKLL